MLDRVFRWTCYALAAAALVALGDELAHRRESIGVLVASLRLAITTPH